MKIGRILSQSTAEIPGMSAAVIYFGGCAYRCPFCYERGMLDAYVCRSMGIQDVYDEVAQGMGLIDAVVFDGGEPTEQEDALYLLMKAFKREGLITKLNTNGENAGIILKMANEKILDYLSIDIKAPLNIPMHYQRMLGKKPDKVLKGIRQILEMAPALGMHIECRTTFASQMMHEHDLVKIAEEVGKHCHLYTIQQMDCSRDMVDPGMADARIYGEKELSLLAKKCRKYAKKVAVRLADGSMLEV